MHGNMACGRRQGDCREVAARSLGDRARSTVADKKRRKDQAMLIDLSDMTVDPLCEDAQKLYDELREVASLAESAILLDRFLWSKDRPEVHFGALCPAGVDLLLTPQDGRHASRLLGDAAESMSESGLTASPFLCPDCEQKGNTVLHQVHRGGLFRAKVLRGVISVMYFGDAQEMAAVERTLIDRNLVSV